MTPFSIVYYGSKPALEYFLDTENDLHPSQIDYEISPFLFLFGLLISIGIASAVLLTSRISVRRIYYNQSTSSFRLIVGNIIGNRHFTVRPGDIVCNNSIVVTHKLGDLHLYMTAENFHKGFYHSLLLGDIEHSLSTDKSN